MVIIRVLAYSISSMFTTIYFVYSWIQLQRKPTIQRLLFTHVLSVAWFMFSALELIAPTDTLRMSFVTINRIVICMIAYFVMLSGYFIKLNYAEPIKNKFLLIALPTVTVIVNVLDFFFYFQNVGFNEIVHKILGITISIYYFIMLIWFVYHMRNSKHHTSHQKMSIFFSVILTTIYIQVLYISKGFPIVYYILITALPFLLILHFIVTRKYLLYDPIVPAIDQILDHIHQAIVVFDNDYEIIDYNEHFFLKGMDLKDKNLDVFIEKLKPYTSDLDAYNIYTQLKELTEDIVSGQLRVEQDGVTKEFGYYINSIFDRNHHKIATMITFGDMTEIQELNQSIVDKNRLLVEANAALKEHLGSVKELTAEKEREVLLKELNDVMGHFMTELLALLEVNVLLIDQDAQDDALESSINDTLERARYCLSQIREAVSKYKKEA